MIKVGIIGTNFGIEYHLPAFEKHPEFHVVAVAGNNYGKTQNIAEDYGLIAYQDWEELIASDVEVVSIATPPFLHYDMAMTALRNHKHILLEKPIAGNATEALEINDLAQKNALVGMLCHEWRYYHPIRELYKLLHEEQLIGELQRVHFQDLIPYAYNKKYSWESDASLAGGWLGVAGSHIFDLVRYLCKAEFVQVFGTTGIRIPERNDHEGNPQQVTAEDEFSMLFEMNDNIRGSIVHISTIDPSPPSRIIFVGSEGTMYTEGSNILIPEKAYLGKPGSKYEPIAFDKNPHSIAERGIGAVMHDLFDELISSFHNRMEGGSSGPDLYDGWKNQEIIDAVRYSSEANKPVKIGK